MQTASNSNTTGILLALGGGVVLSLNDLAIKALSGAYALHQVILIRAIVGITLVLAVMWVSKAGLQQMRTRRVGAHVFRVCIVMV